MVEDSHHVAWKDRLGLNRIWEQCILNCIKTFGTEQFIDNVECFRSTLVNVHDGPNLKNLVDQYFNNELKTWKNDMLIKWVEKNKAQARNPAILKRTKDEYNIKVYQFLFSFIIQTLEDHGFGFYQSKLEEDEIM